MTYFTFWCLLSLSRHNVPVEVLRQAVGKAVQEGRKGPESTRGKDKEGPQAGKPGMIGSINVCFEV